MSIVLQQTNFPLWEAALLTQDPATVADLYAEGATLLPTMASELITDQGGIEEYFVSFLASGPKVAILEEEVVHLSDQSYLHCGHYRFELQATGATVDARFSMVWIETGEGWKILHHHSSRLP